MAPRKKNRTSQENVYYLNTPSAPAQYAMMQQALPPQSEEQQEPPPRQGKAQAERWSGQRHASEQQSMSPDQQQQQQQQQQAFQGLPVQMSAQGAVSLAQYPPPPLPDHLQQGMPPAFYYPPVMGEQEQTAMMEEYEVGTAANALCAFADDLRMVKLAMQRGDNEMKVFIHRQGANDTVLNQYSNISNLRADQAKVSKMDANGRRFIASATTRDDSNATKEEDTDGGETVDEDFETRKEPVELSIQFTPGDVIFANGNHRGKRRAEVFKYYSELHKFKEKNRDALFAKDKLSYQKELKECMIPRPLVTESCDLREEQDTLERRDLELLRLRFWRRYQRNENMKLFYSDSYRVYKDAVNSVDRKLEKLKQHFIKQSQQISSMDKELCDISSSRAEKLFTSNDDLSITEFETVTGIDSSTSGFKPGQRQRTHSSRNLALQSGAVNTSESESDKRSFNRDGHLKRVMKRYSPPDELKTDEIENDLVLLRSL
ncbi:uncharacterized protein CYBJADRAFT_166730 [Cyberlindnera jadinii NRRL Y-1542]|uniref:Uncharacterized protein n=1 Tax=Cyberlindnera jadinii (strain ATCC 18201 / CBS 1600 / BCRC 20928 / JCM 3617 / NBRC 0987 / NRRL Y-1542) TaxID=983966 RepID=A0A1E4S659_CYBJN|nr:hypothetical protein CYBJADRAFT_166730 [Cyberlindnera jadinii NRRL Y-1542]ODV74953.1 hypothetical protein CYBJADRAFT_166730 [Cyberlindnera jadinii NRRL Y-1542]